MQPLNSGKLPPITHRQIVAFMQALGYDVDTRGMCYGYTHVAIMAALLGQFDVYTRRLRLLRKIYHENLDLVLNENMPAEEKRQRLEEYLETVYVAKNEGPKEEHSTKTDILAFFDAIVVYQGSYLNRHLFPRGENLSIQSFKDSFLLVSPTVFDGKRKAGIEGREDIKDGEEDDFALGTIMVNPFGCGVYQREHLERYFGELQRQIHKVNPERAVCLRMENECHTFVVSYSSRKKKWTLIDSGELEYYPGEELTTLSETVFARLNEQRHESVAINTILYTHFDDGKYIKELFARSERNSGMHAKPMQDLTSDEQFELLYIAVTVDDSFTISRILHHGKVYINKTSKTGFTPLMIACENGNLNIVKILIRGGADSDISDQNGSRPLLLACEYGHLDIVDYLIEIKVQLNKADRHGNTPLIIACQEGHLRIAKALIDAGAKINQNKKNGLTLLMNACANGHLDIVALLIQRGADVNETDFSGFTALMTACHEGHEAVVEYLLANNASHTITARASLEVLKFLAKDNSRLDRLESLLIDHWDFCKQDYIIPKLSPLFVAVFMGHEAIVKMLLKKTDTAELNKEPVCLISLAKAMGHASIARLLMAKARPELYEAYNQALVEYETEDLLYRDARMVLDAVIQERQPKSNVRDSVNVHRCLNDFERLHRLLLRAQGRLKKGFALFSSLDGEKIKNILESVCDMKIDNTTQVVDILRAFRLSQSAKQGVLERTVQSRGACLARAVRCV